MVKTFDDYVKKSKEIHSDKYEYISLKKIENVNFLEIKCFIHGIFEKKISNHINNKQGCPNCTKINKLTNDIFINRAKEKHGNKYNYSNVEYINGMNKVKIICSTHGIFEQLPQNHLNGQECPECACKKVTTKSFIERSIKLHGDKYDYSQVLFKVMTEPVKIICKIHGLFEQQPRYHLDSNGCYKCSGITKNTDDFIINSKLIHNDLFDYSKVKYESTRKQVIIICKTHGEFKQTPNDHLSGYGCLKCGKGNYSKISIKWLEEIMKKENIFIQHAMNIGEKVIIINNKKYKVDGYCEKTNTVYEFDGDIFHGNPNKYNKNDINPITKNTYGELYEKTLIKETEIKNAGYNLIKIWENDFKLQFNK